MLVAAALAVSGFNAPVSQGTVSTGASPDRTAALTGQSVSVARTSIAATATLALVGQNVVVGLRDPQAPLSGHSVAAGQGTVSPTGGTVSSALTGQSVTVAANIPFSADASATPTGQAVAASRGSVVPGPLSFALVGVPLSATQGTVTATTGATASLTGQSVSVSRGSVVASGGDTNVSISGQSLVASQGTAGSTASAALTGQSVTATKGSVTSTANSSLTGQNIFVGIRDPQSQLAGHSLGVAQGSVSPTGGTFTAALTGQSVAVDQWSITVGPDGSATLTGQSLGAAAGTLTASSTAGVTGQNVIVGIRDPQAQLAGHSVAVGQGSVGATGGTYTAALTGQSIVVDQYAVTPSGDVTLALAGVTLTTAQGSVAAPNSFTAALVGQSITVGLGSVSVPGGATVSLTGVALATAQGFLTVYIPPIDPVPIPLATSPYSIRSLRGLPGRFGPGSYN